jgi:hypothetical protein
MVNHGFETLYDAVKGQEADWNDTVLAAVEHAVAELGPEIYRIEWADKHAKAASAERLSRPQPA